MSSLRCGNTIIAGLKVRGVRGEAGLAMQRLRFEITFELNRTHLNQRTVVTSLGGDLHVCGSALGGIVGRVYAAAPQLTLVSDHDATMHVFFEMTHSNVEALERPRAVDRLSGGAIVVSP